MNWTKDKPDRAGWYFWRPREDVAEETYKTVFLYRGCRTEGLFMAYELMYPNMDHLPVESVEGGEWYGPIGFD